MAVAMFEQPLLLFRMHRRNRRHKRVLVFIIVFLLLLFGCIAHRLLPQQTYLQNFAIVEQVIPHSIGYNILLVVIALLLLTWLLRPRYFMIDRTTGMLYYSRYILGTKAYYFVEVKQIECEVDMSQVLLKLNSVQLHSIYLRLHNNKLLLITEEYDKETTEQLCQQLRSIFQVEIHHLQKIGHRHDGEMHLGNYVIQRELSHGGMGKVFLAEDCQTKQQVALKVLPAKLALQQDNVTHFAREIRILQRMNHSGVVKIVNVGREKDKAGNDIYFYAMEYIEGRTVSTLIKNREITLEQAVLIVIQTALALDYIHRNGVIHRDIKPSNIMLKNTGQCVLIDFGIARDSILRRNGNAHYWNDDSLTHNLGTLPYMSPEQLTPSARIDHRTDLYSLGITLYEMLCNQRPFEGTDQTIFHQILTSDPPQPSTYNPKIAKDLDAITMAAIAKLPEQRYQTGVEFASDLHRFLRGEPISLEQKKGLWKRFWQKFGRCFSWLWVEK